MFFSITAKPETIKEVDKDTVTFTISVSPIPLARLLLAILTLVVRRLLLTLPMMYSPITQLIGYFKASNSGNQDQFGISVTFSADGKTLAVGADYEASSAKGIDGNQKNDGEQESGAAYIFALESIWRQTTYIKASNTSNEDWFGYSIALSGDGKTLAVEAYQESSNATGINGDQSNNQAGSSGAVYLY